MKKQLATTLEEKTIKKIRLLGSEYNLGLNEVLEVVLHQVESDDISGCFAQALVIYKNSQKINKV